MGFVFSIIIIAMVLAFNLFAADTMMRMRSDIQVIRKSLNDNGNKAAPAPAAPAAAAVAAAAVATPPTKAPALPPPSPASSSPASSRSSTPPPARPPPPKNVQNAISAIQKRL